MFLQEQDLWHPCPHSAGGLPWVGEVLMLSFYPTLIGVKLDLTSYSMGFERSKPFFVWQPGLLLFMVLPIYHHLQAWRLCVCCHWPSDSYQQQNTGFQCPAGS